jgi:hypothetical protein
MLSSSIFPPIFKRIINKLTILNWYGYSEQYADNSLASGGLGVLDTPVPGQNSAPKNEAQRYCSILEKVATRLIY